MAEAPKETERRATPAEAAGEAQKRLDSMLEAVDPARPVAIYTHDHPDPDSIASAYAMQHLLGRRLEIEPIIAYGGRIGRATNHAMVDQLGVRLYPLAKVRTSDFGTNILIDTQPETGNHSIPADLPIAIAIDHHPVRPETSRVRFADIRTEYGATSTIMYYYLKAAGLDLPTRLATALLFGIKSDTRGLEREASEADLHAYLDIFPHADLTLLTRIENPLIPRSHFEVFHKALEESEIVGNAVVTDIGQVDNADVVAELADFLIPLERVDYALVMGRHRDRLYLSLRTRDEGHDAGRLISTVVGDLGTAGGHGKMAGGQIELGPGGSDPADEVRRRLKAALGLDEETTGKPLIRDGEG
ncbi:MAG: DHH family phosphoesterase [Gemmatimonadota bacterium]